MAPLNIISLTVQDFNTLQKRTNLFRSVNSLKAHILFLQETHFTAHSTLKFFSSFYPQTYTASATTKQRGTLIAFHRSIPFTLKAEINDPKGCYLILTGYIMELAITIVSYYAPNKQPTPFFSHLMHVVSSHKIGTIIMC